MRAAVAPSQKGCFSRGSGGWASISASTVVNWSTPSAVLSCNASVFFTGTTMPGPRTMLGTPSVTASSRKYPALPDNRQRAPRSRSMQSR